MLCLPRKPGKLYPEFPCSQQQFHSTLWFSVLLFLGPGWKCWFNTDPFLIRTAGWGEMRLGCRKGCEWGQLGLNYPACTAFGNWLRLNAGPRVSRPVTFWVVSTEQRKNPFSRWNGGEVWITHPSSRLGVMVETGRGLERPTEAFFCLVCAVFISEMETSVSGTGSQGSAWWHF